MEWIVPGIFAPPYDDVFTEQRRSELRALAEGSGVAKTILQQLGGAGKVYAMLGKKTQMVSYPNALSIKFANRKPSKGNYVKITLHPNDTYDVDFSSVTKGGLNVKKVKRYSGVMFDQLIPIFEKQTGLRLRL